MAHSFPWSRGWSPTKTRGIYNGQSFRTWISYGYPQFFDTGMTAEAEGVSSSENGDTPSYHPFIDGFFHIKHIKPSSYPWLPLLMDTPIYIHLPSAQLARLWWEDQRIGWSSPGKIGLLIRKKISKISWNQIPSPIHPLHPSHWLPFKPGNGWFHKWGSSLIHPF